MILEIAIDNMIRFTITSQLKSEFPGLMNWLRSELIVDNPEYIWARRKGRSTFRIPPKLTFFSFNAQTGEIALPRGYWPRFLDHLKACGVPHKLNFNNAEGRRVMFESSIKLRDYQIPAVEKALEAQSGLVEAPCGSGKTQMGLEIIARHGQNAAWLTHTLDLANQVIERAQQCLGLSGEQIGLYGNGKRQIGTHLTVVLIPTLAQPGCEFPFEDFGLVLIDEVHHSPAGTWAPVINKFPAVHRYGVTATLERADGLEIATHLYVGPTIYKISPAEVKDAGGTITPKLEVHYTKTKSATWDAYQAECEKIREHNKASKADGKPEKPEPKFSNYGGLQTELFADPDRNAIIITLLAVDGPGHYSLVLSDRVVHCRLLCDLLKRKAPQLKAEIIHGKLSKAERQRIIDETRAGKIRVLFAVDIAKEGLDIPRLDRLYLVAGGRNEAELVQKAGRIMRPSEGKADAKIIDFVDGEIGLMKAQYYARRRVYRQLGIIA